MTRQDLTDRTEKADAAVSHYYGTRENDNTDAQDMISDLLLLIASREGGMDDYANRAVRNAADEWIEATTKETA